MSDDHDDLIALPAEPPAPLAPLIVPAARPPRRRPSRARYRLRRALALAVLVVIGFAAWFAIELFQPFTGSGTGSVRVTIPSGYSARQIGDLLAHDGVVDSGFFFNLRAIVDGDRSKMRAGTFTLRHGMSYAAALTVLTTAPPVSQPTVRAVAITIPEGFTRLQIAVRAHTAGLRGSYLKASRSSRGFHPRSYGAPRHLRDLEGFLFPDTYDLERGEPAVDLVRQQLLAFQQNFDGLDFKRARAAKLSRYDVLIIASMIQGEAKVPGDFPLVAAVIYNRLRDGMTLGIDATLRYYLNDYTRPLTQSELDLNTPYNTNLHHGLPPTPISNPGLEAMTAAVDPAHVSYLYYVNKPYTCGKLAFATTYAQFLTDKTAYDTARAKNGGREPSRCP
jgi:uncharacterized YceG family protein